MVDAFHVWRRGIVDNDVQFEALENHTKLQKRPSMEFKSPLVIIGPYLVS